jgi:hypothetical protein
MAKDMYQYRITYKPEITARNEKYTKNNNRKYAT